MKATICPPFCEGMSDGCEQTWGGPPDSLGVEGGVERRPAPPPTFSQKSLFPLPSARHRCGLRDLVLCCPLVSTSKITVPGSPAPRRKPCRCFPCCLVRCRQQPCETAVIIAAFSVKKAHLCSSIWKISSPYYLPSTLLGAGASLVNFLPQWRGRSGLPGGGRQ